MNITIKDTTYEVKYGFRALMIYENITGESFQPNGLNSILTLLYCCVMAANKDATIDFNDFVDELDEQPQIISDFSKYIVGMLTKNSNITEKNEVVENKKKATKTRKKE